VSETWRALLPAGYGRE